MQTSPNRLNEALENCARALREDPENPELLAREAMLLDQLDRRIDALHCVDRALQIRPGDLVLRNVRIVILDHLGRYDDGLAEANRLLKLHPEHLDALNNRGMLLARLGCFQDALACYDRSLALQPEQPLARYNRALTRLALSDWIRGFQEFESRWTTQPLVNSRPVGLARSWLGEEDLNQKTLLLYHEQGYGDTLQCVRYVPMLAERGARVILSVPPELAGLVRSVPGVAQVVSTLQPLPAHDLQTPLMSLPLSFRTTPDTVPGLVPYIAADPSRVQWWRHRLGPWSRPRIGLVWGGRRHAAISIARDIPLAALRPLLELDAEFISLQKDIAQVDRDALVTMPRLRRCGEELEDFADAAALVQSLDLIVTVDTAMAHLGGALGKPVWLMNRYASCWRWLQDGDGSSWYPTLRQFRQAVVGEWCGVVMAIEKAARDFIIAAHGPGVHSVDRPATEVVRRSVVNRQTIRVVSSTRGSSHDFFADAPLGRSLPRFRHFPRRQKIELRLFAGQQDGLPGVYNLAIEEARADPAVLVFIHDHVYLSDDFWVAHLHAALEHFDLVGLIGNRRRVPRQVSWIHLDDQFTRDDENNLSGVIGHGESCSEVLELSAYGEPGQEVKLLDGVMMAIRSQTVIEKDLRFDARFKFDFYDMDFCRQAEARKLRMGTCPMSVVRVGAATPGVDWRMEYRAYLDKYGDT